MPKQRQIPFLVERALAGGGVSYHWQPSARLKKAGFESARLGTDFADAVAQAIERNRQLAEWEKKTAEGGTAAYRPPAPRIVRFADLVATYRASSDFTDLRKKTRDEYDVRLRQLQSWALDGTLPVRSIDLQLVTELRDELMKGSRYRAAAILRVLRLLLAFAERSSIIPKGSNPATNIRIPEPDARTNRMPGRVRDAIVAAADALGLDDVALAIPLGFWTIQREGDLLRFNRMTWRNVSAGDDDVDPRHLATLVDARGKVMGFAIQQSKTAAWIEAPLPPFLSARVAERFERQGGSWLFPHPSNPAAEIPSHLFQRRFRTAQGAAVAVAIMEGDVAFAEAINACQFRDLRRTGMIAYKQAGAKDTWITSLSGHFVLGRKSILDTYMPTDTAGAIACVASGYRAYLARERREAASG